MPYNNNLQLPLRVSQVSTKESRSGSQVAPELTGVSEPVAAKRNLFEAGEAWNQSGATVSALKV